MTGEPTIVDTNVLVYAYDADGGHKHTMARARLEALWESESGLISTQVIRRSDGLLVASPFGAPPAE